MSTADAAQKFRSTFQRWSRRVRRRLALNVVLTGAAVGMLVGTAGAVAAWQTRQGSLRPWGAVGGVLGAAAGALVARRRRWSDESVALYLDSKLASDEAIATAVELEDREATDAARAVVISQATSALDAATPKKVRAPMWRSWHAAVPVFAGAIAYISLLPLPPAPATNLPPPGTDIVQMADIAGLEKIINLADIDARDEAQRQRLKKLADDAKKLREKLRNGVEKREALADIAKLKDALTAERLSLGDGEQRQGMESALGKMAENPDLKDATKALGDRDLVQFDDEMEKLANRLEKQDRERAKKTLEEAEQAAKKAGAPDVAKALEEQRKLLEKRGKQAEKLKELAKSLGEGLSQEGREALGDMGQSGSPKDTQKLAENLEKALGQLSPEERKQLAENLKKQMSQMPDEALGEGPSKEQMKELAEQMGSEEGQKQLEQQLKEMAKAPQQGSDEADRQKALEDAQKGAGECEGQLGQTPVPMPVAGNKPGQGQNKPGDKSGSGKGQQQGNGANQGNQIGTDGGGKGDHKGQTGVVAGGELTSKANAKINKGKPMPGIVLGRTAGRPGETANVQGEGALGTVGPDEVSGIERSEVPEEYREQVGRYFQPK